LDFTGPTSKGRKGLGRKKEGGDGKGREEKGGNGKRGGVAQF